MVQLDIRLLLLLLLLVGPKMVLFSGSVDVVLVDVLVFASRRTRTLPPPAWSCFPTFDTLRQFSRGAILTHLFVEERTLIIKTTSLIKKIVSSKVVLS